MEMLLNMKEKGILPAICFFIFICVLVLSGCCRQEEENLQTEGQPSGGGGDYTLETKVTDVINDPVFEDYGRLIFPVDRTIDQRKGIIAFFGQFHSLGKTVMHSSYINKAAAFSSSV